MGYTELIRRVHKRLLKRHSSPRNKNLLAVGLGWAFKKGKPDPQRGLSFIYLVRKKKKRPPANERIPPTVVVMNSDGKRRRRITLKTDVVAIGKVVPTGFQAEPQWNDEVFLVGALVSWGEPGNLSWGLLTVGHGLVGRANNDRSITVVLPEPPPIVGTLFRSTLSTDPIDAALIRLNNPADVARFNAYLPADGKPLSIRTLDQLWEDGAEANSGGTTLTASPPPSFAIQAYYPTQDPSKPIIPETPNRIDLLQVSGVRNEFRKGTSGAVWLAASGEVDALQVGANEGGFDKGFGQAMQACLDWANTQVPGIDQPVQLMAVF